MAAVDQKTSQVNLRWLTDYEEGASEKVSIPYLVKTAEDRFLMLWSQGNELVYLFVDADGNPVGAVNRVSGQLSDCEPQLSENHIIWYTWKGEEVTFYKLDLSAPEDLETITKKPGHALECLEVINGTERLKCSK